MRVLLVLFTVFVFSSSGIAAEHSKVWPISDYKIQGTGQTNIVIIPCMSCRWRSFDQFMDRNQDKYAMYAVTVPGFGGSLVPELPLWSDQPVWHRNAVAALKLFIEEHDIQDAIVVSHSWGSVISAELLAEDPSFAKGWIILDTHVPFDSKEQTAGYRDKLNLVAKWREESMEPYRGPDQWAQFNKPAAYIPHERQILYHGMFMATPRDVVFQYWRENGLVNINDAFARIKIPVLEVKSIPPQQEDVEAGKKRYLARYETAPHPESFKTVFVEKSGHHIIEQRPMIIDEIVERFVKGGDIFDYSPDE